MGQNIFWYLGYQDTPLFPRLLFIFFRIFHFFSLNYWSSVSVDERELCYILCLCLSSSAWILNVLVLLWCLCHAWWTILLWKDVRVLLCGEQCMKGLSVLTCQWDCLEYTWLDIILVPLLTHIVELVTIVYYQILIILFGQYCILSDIDNIVWTILYIIQRLQMLCNHCVYLLCK